MRALLLELFKKWGLPQAIRTDNGLPFGMPTRQAVPMLSLWLVAWGIRPILNRPRRPTDNAKVERNQGTSSRWAEVDDCPDLKTLQTRLNDTCRLQRDCYPVRRLGNASRRAVFKELYEIKRPFDETLFDEKKAHEYLAKATYPRKVNRTGAINLYNKQFQVARKHRGKTIWVKFDPAAIAWLVSDQNQNLLNTIPDSRFSKENLFNLAVFQ